MATIKLREKERDEIETCPIILAMATTLPSPLH
jgi:hypothetical protein